MIVTAASANVSLCRSRIFDHDPAWIRPEAGLPEKGVRTGGRCDQNSHPSGITKKGEIVNAVADHNVRGWDSLRLEKLNLPVTDRDRVKSSGKTQLS